MVLVRLLRNKCAHVLSIIEQAFRCLQSRLSGLRIISCERRAGLLQKLQEGVCSRSSCLMP